MGEWVNNVQHVKLAQLTPRLLLNIKPDQIIQHLLAIVTTEDVDSVLVWHDCVLASSSTDLKWELLADALNIFEWLTNSSTSRYFFHWLMFQSPKLNSAVEVEAPVLSTVLKNLWLFRDDECDIRAIFRFSFRCSFELKVSNSINKEKSSIAVNQLMSLGCAVEQNNF